jgi:hypothetical protein
MKIQLKAIFLSAALAAMLLPVAAQDSTTTTPTPDPPSAQKPPTTTGKEGTAELQKNDQERIANGIKSGELTSKEAARLEHKQARMNKEIQAMRAANGGQLTAADKAKIQRQQGTLSKEIYNNKHDAQVQGGSTAGGKGEGNNPISQTKENQQDRIAQGVANGQLTSAEASKLENQQTHINNETSKLRAEQGGKLTDAQKQKIEHQQKAVSRHITRQKHDAQHTSRR